MEIPLDRPRFPELDSPGTFGTTLEEEGFAARVHEQSIGLPLNRILEKVGAQALPRAGDSSSREIENLYSRFTLWLVPHSFSLLRRSGRAEPTSVGLQIQYLNESRTCSILALLPSYREIVHGVFQASLSLSGDVSPLEQPAEALGAFSHCGLDLAATGNVGLSVAVRAKVVTPYISAVGTNSDQAEWRFDKHDHALFGHDVLVWTVVALPKRQRALKWRARFYAVVRRFIVSKRIESNWTEDLECMLDG